MRISKNTAFTLEAAGGLISMASGSWYFRDVVSKVCFDCCSGPNQQIGLTLAQSLLLAGSFFDNGFSLTGKIVRSIVDVEGEEKSVAKKAKQHFSKDTASLLEPAGGLVSMAGGTMYLRDAVSKICFDCCQGRNQQVGLTFPQSLLLATSLFSSGYSVTGKVIRSLFGSEGDENPVKLTAKKRFQ